MDLLPDHRLAGLKPTTRFEGIETTNADGPPTGGIYRVKTDDPIWIETGVPAIGPERGRSALKPTTRFEGIETPELSTQPWCNPR